MKTDIETKYEYIKQYEQGKLSKKGTKRSLKIKPPASIPSVKTV